MAWRPEQQAPPEIFYDDVEARKYTCSSRVVGIQAELSERALDLGLLTLPRDGIPRLLLDIGYGSGVSGETICEIGHQWIGLDIWRSMLDVALERVTEGDLILGDMGQVLGLRLGVIDGAISISALQWLCNADKSCHEPRLRLKSLLAELSFDPFIDAWVGEQGQFFNCILKINPTRADPKFCYAGWICWWCCHRYCSKKRKEYLVLTYGPPSMSTATPSAKGEDENSCSDDETSGDEENQTVCISYRHRPRKKQKVTKKGKTRSWVLLKKEKMRSKGNIVPTDTKYTARKHKARF